MISVTRAIVRLALGTACAAAVAGPSRAAPDTLIATFDTGGSTRCSVVDVVRNRTYCQTTNGSQYLDADNVWVNVPIAGGQPYVYDALLDKLVFPGPGPNQVQLVDPDTWLSVAVDVGGGTHFVAANAALGKIYVASSTSGTVTIIDAATYATTTVSVAAGMDGIGINEATNKVYLPGSPVHVLDGATQAATPLSFSASSLAINPATNRIYMYGPAGTHDIIEVDGSAHTYTAISTGTDVSPFRVLVNPVTNHVWVAGGTAVTDIDAASRTVVKAYGMTTYESTAAINTATNKVYASSWPCHLCPAPQPIVIDATAGSSSPLSYTVHFLVNPVTNRIYSWYTGCVSYACSGAVKVFDGSPAVPQPVPPTTAIGPLAADTSLTSSPRFTFTPSPGLAGMPVAAVFYQVDGTQGRWSRATRSADGTYTASTTGLSNGTHTIHAFAADRGIAPASNNAYYVYSPTPRVGTTASYTFTVANACATTACADLGMARTIVPAVGFTGKDALYRIQATNHGPVAATGVTLREQLPADARFVWATPGCFVTSVTGDPGPGGGAGGQVTTVSCPVGNLGVGASAEATVVFRPARAGTATTVATVTGNELDPQTETNSSSASVAVSDPPPANIVPRYRLYSPVSLEHHFTMDANEYTVLGASGAWVQEGQVGHVLDNPGFYNGVQAVPYYRLYNTFSRWHHWTTDPNEYYTLITYPGWNGEDVAGWIFPTQATGTTELYRLAYPFVPGLHHWTLERNEYDTLVSQYGWVGEGGSGFVIP